MWNQAKSLVSEWRAPPPRTGNRRELLVDVSVIYQSDAHTGIQRVVRGVLENLGEMLAEDVDLVPVAATRRRSYRVVPADFLRRTDRPPVATLLKPSRRRSGDLFLALDLAAHIQPRHLGQIRRWKRHGCRVATVVYDLLPISRPEWFSDTLVRNFGEWVDLHKREADQILCISKSVAADVLRLLERTESCRSTPPAVCDFMLGSDLGTSVPTCGMVESEFRVLELAQSTPSLLCVGTIEPRKGHSDLLDAFACATARGSANWALIVVGRPGWKTEGLQMRLRDMQAQSPSIIWLDRASDELLQALYSRASGVVAASLDEGFGLPIIEALAHGIPVLARDIPVFRELAVQGVEFFQAITPADFADAIERFLGNPPEVAADALLARATWANCARQIAALTQMAPAGPGEEGPELWS